MPITLPVKGEAKAIGFSLVAFCKSQNFFKNYLKE